MRALGSLVSSVLVAITLSGCGGGGGGEGGTTTPSAPDTASSPPPTTSTNSASPTISTNSASPTTSPSVLPTTPSASTGPASTSSPTMSPASSALPTTSSASAASTTSASPVGPTSSTSAGALSVVQAAEADPGLTKLVQYLTQADLVSALEGEGPYTVFAPTNTAFDNVQSEVSALGPTELSNALSYHVGDTLAATAAQLSDGQTIDTLFAGHQLIVDKSDGVTLVSETNNNAKVEVADVICSNGVLHKIDAVLMPTLSSQVPIQA